MGATQTKVSCLWLPAQSGKTKKMTELIDMYRNLIETEQDCIEEEKDNFFNIIICSNNVLLVNQTQKRMKDDLYSDKITIHNEEEKKEEIITNNSYEKVYCWVADKDQKTHYDVCWKVSSEELQMVVCCANKIRLDKYVAPLLENLNKNFGKLFKKKINIWIDEADETINLWSRFENVLDFNVINKITLVSATFDSVIRKYKNINVIPYQNTYAETYVRLKDSRFIILDKKKETSLGYIKSVVYEFNLLDEIKPGFNLFAPGDIDVASHESIKEYFYTKGFVVIILNGKEKKFYIPGDQEIDIKEEMKTENEVSKIIATKCKELKLNEKYPIVVTGQLCLGRGISLQSRDFIFTASIIPHLSKRASLYQLATRICGNIKSYQKEKHIMYCSSKTKKTILEVESCAINVAKICYDTNSTIVDKSTIKQAENIDSEDDNKYEGLKQYVNCNLLSFIVQNSVHEDEVWKKVKETFDKHVNRNTWNYSKLEKQNGFYVCSTTGTPEIQSTNIEKMIKGWKWHVNYNLRENQFTYARLYAGYDDVNDRTKYIIFLRLMSIQQNEFTTKKLKEITTKGNHKTERKVDYGTDEKVREAEEVEQQKQLTKSDKKTTHNTCKSPLKSDKNKICGAKCTGEFCGRHNKEK